jgi:hypothetical protein
MNHSFFTPDLGTDTDSPFARDAAGKLVRRSYWLDLSDPFRDYGYDTRSWCPSDQRDDQIP